MGGREGQIYNFFAHTGAFHNNHVIPTCTVHVYMYVYLALGMDIHVHVKVLTCTLPTCMRKFIRDIHVQ